MSNSGIPGLNENAAKYVQRALMPELSDAEATAEFTKYVLTILFAITATFMH